MGVKFRYRQPDQPAKMRFEGDRIYLHYEDHPVEAVTPGQIGVIYQGETMRGGGIIGEIYRHGQQID